MNGLKETTQLVGLDYVARHCLPEDMSHRAADWSSTGQDNETWRNFFPLARHLSGEEWKPILAKYPSLEYARYHWTEKLAATLKEIRNELHEWKNQNTSGKARSFTISDYLTIHRDDRRIIDLQPACVHIACRLAFELELENEARHELVMVSALTCELPEGSQVWEPKGREELLAMEVGKGSLQRSTQESLDSFSQTVLDSTSVISDDPLVHSDDESTSGQHTVVQYTPATTVDWCSPASSIATSTPSTGMSLVIGSRPDGVPSASASSSVGFAKGRRRRERQGQEYHR